MQTVTSLAGYEVRVLMGAVAVDQRLTLQFSNLLEVDGRQITDHYALAEGGFHTFDLPSAVLAGMTSGGHLKPSNSKWRYASPPSVTYEAPGIQSVSVTLVAVPE
jgi:hypothetical protein